MSDYSYYAGSPQHRRLQANREAAADCHVLDAYRLLSTTFSQPIADLATRGMANMKSIHDRIGWFGAPGEGTDEVLYLPTATAL